MYKGHCKEEGIFFANLANDGCKQRKCPCEMWINCRQYTNTWKCIHPEKMNREVYEWYDTNFRIKYEFSEIIGNG